MLVCVVAHCSGAIGGPPPARSRPGLVDGRPGRRRGSTVIATEENAMTLRPGRGLKASLISLVMVATACSSGGGQSAAPLPGCNSGTTQVLFWTSHTPPDTDSMKHMVDAFNKQSITSCVKMVAVP